VRPPHPLALVVIGHAALLAAVDLHVGGIQVDGDRPAGQRRRARSGQYCQHPPGYFHNPHRKPEQASWIAGRESEAR